MQSGEPCWLVVCSLRDVYREMVYDRAMRQIFPHHDLSRFVEILPRLCPRNMDMEYSYAVAPYRVESGAQRTEDYARRWRAFGPGGLDYPSLRAVDNFPARSEYRGPHLRLWVVRRRVGVLDTYGPRHPRLPCGRFADYYHLHSLYSSGRSPAYEPLGIHAPSVASSVMSEEVRPRGSEGYESEPSSPVSSSASTPSTSVGGSPPGNTTPRHAPGAPEPPPRRRRLEPESALFPATPEPVDEEQSPSAPAHDNSAGAGADSSADASHSIFPEGRCLHVLVSLHCSWLGPPSRKDLRPSRFLVVLGTEAQF
ncbi:hypothetical protein Emag_006060 [Eimeria magna]